MTYQFTLEHPKGSGTNGPVFSVSDTTTVRTDRGLTVATAVAVGCSIYLSKTVSAKVLEIASV